jgi:hypothetical protein
VRSLKRLRLFVLRMLTIATCRDGNRAAPGYDAFVYSLPDGATLSSQWSPAGPASIEATPRVPAGLEARLTGRQDVRPQANTISECDRGHTLTIAHSAAGIQDDFFALLEALQHLGLSAAGAAGFDDLQSGTAIGYHEGRPLLAFAE